ncbi:venom serine carboxypeptidase-like [Cylas formicarius]|uniref:venom serine carboxypeptidase-like n=1 Tax=Cylas formicarius TaxID=197179 RepID=UPI002958DEF5|nr:venom serine carboxypeptidase-like [Cylas formicarius]XP_060527440.1 venom serine carboxypeptidase-like [Cylas formicarius]
MVNGLWSVFIAIQLVHSSNCYVFNHAPPVRQFKIRDDVGDPLILTPYLEQNQIEEARQAALVNYGGFQDIVSYAGYFTVDKAYNSNQWFWFFPSENDYENDPVLLWLQGGPGSSSLFALFTENGPFIIDGDLNVTIREIYWSQFHSVLYIDNPVGSGFSFTDEDGYAQNETKVGSDLYNSLLQFFTLFPELQNNDFFLTGESYAGKYVPAIGYTIHQNNPTADLKINLKGLIIGNGWTDPVNQLDYGEYLYQVGLLDVHQRAIMDGYKQAALENILVGDFANATNYANRALLFGISELAEIADIYNYLNVRVDPNERKYEEFVQTVVRKEIHVGDTVYGNGNDVYDNLWEDIPQSVAPWLSELLSHYSVLLFNGQTDTVCPYPPMVNYISKLNFSAAEEYKTAAREYWVIDDEVVGYIKTAGNLTELFVRDAGHYVPRDQPKWTISFVSRFARGLPINEDE